MFWFRLIRFQNLFLIALTQYLIRFAVIQPIFLTFNRPLALSEFNFALLVFSTLLIAAGGYIINDIFDMEIDALNKPHKKIIGEKLSITVARKIYYAISNAGILIGIYLTYVADVRPLALINLLTVGLLYFYSQSYKHILLVGNIVISFLSALSVFIVALSETELIYTINHLNLAAYNTEVSNMRVILAIITAYSGFAFLVSLIRELVKDMEDLEGDKNFGSQTMPAVLGIRKTKLFVSLLILTLLFSLVNIQLKQLQWENKISFLYTIVAIEIPLLITGIFILLAKRKKQFSISSLLIKLIMLAGILSMPVFYFST